MLVSIEPALILIQEQGQKMLEIRSSLDAIFDESVYKIEGLFLYKKLTKQFESTFSRVFNSEYKDIKGEFEFCMHQNKSLSMAKQLMDYQKLSADYKLLNSQVIAKVGPVYQGLNTNWDELYHRIFGAQNILFGAKQLIKINDLGNIPNYQSFAPYKAAFASGSTLINSTLEQLDMELILPLVGCSFYNILLLIPCSVCKSRLKL